MLWLNEECPHWESIEKCLFTLVVCVVPFYILHLHSSVERCTFTLGVSGKMPPFPLIKQYPLTMVVSKKSAQKVVIEEMAFFTVG